MRVHIGGDHAAYELQQDLIAFLKAEGHEVTNHGPFEVDPLDDYPVFVLRAAEAVAAMAPLLGDSSRAMGLLRGFVPDEPPAQSPRPGGGRS